MHNLAVEKEKVKRPPIRDRCCRCGAGRRKECDLMKPLQYVTTLIYVTLTTPTFPPPICCPHHHHHHHPFFFFSQRIKPVARQAMRQLPWERLQTELGGGCSGGDKDGVEKKKKEKRKERCWDRENVCFYGGGASMCTCGQCSGSFSVLFVSFIRGGKQRVAFQIIPFWNPN